jgi:hypothetical protein
MTSRFRDHIPQELGVIVEDQALLSSEVSGIMLVLQDLEMSWSLRFP